MIPHTHRSLSPLFIQPIHRSLSLFLLLAFLLVPPLRPTTPLAQTPPLPKIRILPEPPLWSFHAQQAVLHLDLHLQSTPQEPLSLRFAQLYAASKGQTLHIHVFSKDTLLAYARRFDSQQRAWLPHHSTDLPPSSDLVLSLPPLRYPRHQTPDSLLLRLYFQQGPRALQRTLSIQPQSPALPHLRFPVRGRWWVANGHGPAAPHRHRLREPSAPFLAPQRFALDLLRIDHNNRIHRGAPHQNESFLGFSEQVYAPADGQIHSIERHHPDPHPGRPDKQNPLGNYILIQHTHQLFSLLAHLKQGSIQVEPKQSVKAGQWIARVGNSGDGSTPHLHFQLLRSPQPESAPSLPPLFWGLSAPLGTFSPFCPQDGQIVLAF
ncbi:M23 family metallopeptidase [Myxococcota bacterium]|nr:M23 family metallopeptidase [Myxococcota bacterium]